MPGPTPDEPRDSHAHEAGSYAHGHEEHEHDLPSDVLILYASETGNAQDLAERTARAFRAHHRRARLLSMDAYDVADLPHEPLVVFITSTHGRGDPPPAMRVLWGKLLRSGLPSDILEDVHYTVYGLGDTSYERFCYAGKVLARRLDALGATALVEPAWGDERAPEGYEETFVPWLKRTLEVVVPYLLGPSTAPLEDTELPPPLYVFGYTGRSADAAAESAQTAAEAEAEDTSATLAALSLYDSDNNVAGPSSTSRASSSTAYAPPGWKWATLTTARRLTPKEWWQDVREFELELDSENEGDEAYPPGAVAALHPQCSAGEVSTFLELNGLEAEADREFVLSTGDTDTSLPPHLPTRPTTLRQLLTHHLDLRCAPRKSFFEWLRRLSTDEREIERLDEFIADPDEVHDYATRPSRTVLETQADFRLTRIPLAYVPEVLSPLRRRQFSIASDYSAHKGKIQLLIAMVQYKTNLSVPRVGLCSSWLSGLNEGARIPYALLPPTLFLPAPHVPVILVGPGTGVAPMRAFMEARVGQGAAKGTALYFGCRSVSQDLYFASDWDAHRSEGALVRIAVSRDGPKVYVQDLLRKDSVFVHDWLVNRRGHIYISGSSNAMPREVREAVAWCISSEGAGTFSAEEAEAFVESMFEDGRGGEESW